MLVVQYAGFMKGALPRMSEFFPRKQGGAGAEGGLGGADGAGGPGCVVDVCTLPAPAFMLEKL